VSNYWTLPEKSYLAAKSARQILFLSFVHNPHRLSVLQGFQ